MLFWWLKRPLKAADMILDKGRGVTDKETEARKRALLLGVGFDGADGHTRITRGANFYLVGGSEPTHEQMQEKAVRFNEELKKRGRQIEQISRDEFYEIAERLDMGAVPKS